MLTVSVSPKNITSKSDLKYFIKADMIANHAEHFPNRLLSPQYHYLKLLRKCAYYHNVSILGVIGKFIYYWYAYRSSRYGYKFGWSIGINAVGPGLYLPHVGTVIINGYARIGKNLTINAGSVIGWGKVREDQKNNCPIIGDNVTIDAGCIIFNPITIADDIRIGANSVVNKSFDEKGITIAGSPAKKIGDAYIHEPLCAATFELEKRMKLQQH